MMVGTAGHPSLPAAPHRAGVDLILVTVGQGVSGRNCGRVQATNSRYCRDDAPSEGQLVTGDTTRSRRRLRWMGRWAARDYFLVTGHY
ncbi:hypothetical protein CBR_g23082 [Chara braunii]|uniref:Uncharacterized protein n=1 Tax=Chara braunii TaxID=69332 RepID=A0A388L3J7_CHABU|nr:hypothetical protein CBR_g23082 [Chara braunii]|eukprot:GBG76867.1 hypothetical protein CBR_g23082 [Chara braunii]